MTLRDDKSRRDPDVTAPEDDFWASVQDETMAEAEDRLGDTVPAEDAWDDILDATLQEAMTRTDGETTPEIREAVRDKRAASPKQPAPIPGGSSYSRGDTLQNTYRVLSDAHEGGMGAVWEVSRREWPDTSLAMKRPKPEAFRTRKQKEDFIHECESWINLGLHPNIVSCYYVNEIDGVPTIFSEWMRGGSVERRIRDETLYEGTDSAVRERLLDIAIQFARGLGYAHEKGLVHQDVKPDNLLLTESWEAKVSDFGLAKARSFLSDPEADPARLSDDPNATQMAAGGAMTYAYCSPEQAAKKLLTRRTDIYSWAVSVLEMYLGCKPWARRGVPTGPLVGVVCRDYFEMCTERPVPKALQALLTKCLEQEPADRPHDFGEVERSLLEIYREETGADYARPGLNVAVSTADGLNNQAVSYMEIGLEGSALRCLEKADKIDASHAEAMYNRALIDWRRGIRTGVEIHRQLNAHPYFTKTETGRQALRALAGEAGKSSMDEPLLEGIPGHPIATPEEGYSHVCGVLRHGKVYITVTKSEKDSDQAKMLVLTVYDARTGEELARDDFAQFAEREDRRPVEAVLTNDCTQAMLSMSDDTLILYDLASRSVVREYSLKKTSMYDRRAKMRIIGDDTRFIRREVRHDIKHGRGGSDRELYDLRTQTLIEQQYADWELVHAGADGALSTPKGKPYIRSACDNRRVCMVYEDDSGKRAFCDDDGKPLTPVPPVIAARLGAYGDVDNRTLRITDDRRMWSYGDEGLAEYDLISGKCLRSYKFNRYENDVCVDEDGLGILIVHRGMAIEDEKRWYYRRLEPIRPEDRANWLYAEPENYAGYRDRIRCIEAAAKAFGRAEAAKDNAAMCSVYDEAERIRCFYGTAAQWDMAERLNRLCRQKNGELFLYMDASIKHEGKEREKLLAPYGLGKTLPDELLRHVRKSIQLLSVTEPISISSDGQRALILSQIRASDGPAGPGIYLLDVPTEKLYLLKSYPEKGSYNTTGFCRDRTRIVYGNTFNGVLRCAEISAGSSQARDVGSWEPTVKGIHRTNWHEDLFSQTMYSTAPLPGTGDGASILWPCDIYTFRTEAGRDAFLRQSQRMQILDVSQSHGLIAYLTEKAFCVWSVDEERVLMETAPPKDTAYNSITARFAQTEGGVIRLLVAWTGIADPRPRDRYPVHIYQFRCAYAPEETRRLPPTPQRPWPRLALPECKWSGARSEESILDHKAYELSHINTAESQSEAYDVYCELARRFPAKELHRKNRDIVAAHLKKAMQDMQKAGDTEGLEKLALLFAGRAEKYPDEEKTPELLDFAEDLLAFVLSNREDEDSKRRALALYEGLLDRATDNKKIMLYAKNAAIVKKQLRQLARQNGGSPFSFFGKKK